MRTFIGIDLPAPIREEILTLQDILASQLSGQYRFPKEAQLHLTLKFLGDTDAKTLAYFQQHLSETVSKHETFKLNLEKLGNFGRPPRVIWVGLAGEKKKLYALQNAIVKEEDRSFQAHITVARVSKAPQGAKLEHYLQTLKTLKPQTLSWSIEEVVLYHSELHPKGVQHHVLERYPLKRLSENTCV